MVRTILVAVVIGVGVTLLANAATTIYLPEGTAAHEELLGRLGEHTTGVGCLYIKNLDRVDLEVLERVIESSYRTVTAGTFGQRARDSST